MSQIFVSILRLNIMIRHSKLPKDILDRIEYAASYLETRNDVLFAYLFGGLSKGEPKPLSDVDIAVYLAENTERILLHALRTIKK